MNTFLIAVGLALFALMLPVMYRVVAGPTAIDRIVAVNVIGTKTAVLLIVILSFVAPWARWLPLAVIGGLLVVVAWGLVNPREIRHLWKHEPVDRLPMVVTFAGTLTLSLEWAILLGLATAWVSRRLAGPETGSGSL